MLPANLKKIKEDLVSKGYAKRTTGEDKLLEELEAVDKYLVVTEGVQKQAFATTSGPVGSCPCCGKGV